MCPKKLLVFGAIILFASACTKNESQIESSIQTSNVSKGVQFSHVFLGRQRIITVPTGNHPYPTSRGLLWLPQDYDRYKDSSFPLIFNLYGQGQCGTNLALMLQDSTMSSFIAKGFNATAFNKKDRKTYHYIVFSPQCPTTWGWSAPQVKVMLANLEKSLRIDASRVYLTGFSSGGWGLWSCMTDDESLCSQFAAIAPISSAAADHPELIPNVDKYGIACWSICGNQDAFYQNSVNYTNIINSNNPPIPAVLQTLNGVGHSAWAQAYDSTWAPAPMNINLYNWLIQYKKK